MQEVRTVFFYFLFYSFLGWIIEGLFNRFTRGTFIKPNFLILPFKPMYGIAATLLIYLKQFSPYWVFLIGVFVFPTLVEYTTAYLIFHLFGLKYWDYSHCPHQLSGYICLRFSIYWSILSFLLIYGLHPYVVLLYTSINWFWRYFFPIALLIFITDCSLSIQAKKGFTKSRI